ncbi:MAG: NERD domain-containing protein [Verrucomicrobiales bacterium]
MARWIFNRPVECSDPHERRVAELLKKLGKGWTIRWGFYYRDNAGVLREGDFLIFGPDCGLLVLEVKGTGSGRLVRQVAGKGIRRPIGIIRSISSIRNMRR